MVGFAVKKSAATKIQKSPNTIISNVFLIECIEQLNKAIAKR